MEIDYTTAALLAVDVQNDFCPAYTGKDGNARPQGALAVKGGDTVTGPLNWAAGRLRREGGKVLATQDWHPAGHVSFASSHKGKKAGDVITLPVPDDIIEDFKRLFPALTDPIPEQTQQMLWPDHCVQDTEGAAFHESLDLTLIDRVFRKGCRENVDSYSAFFENDRCTPTELYGCLRELGVQTLLVGGLATDYCVFYSVIDSLRLGFNTFVIVNACMGIDVPAGSVKEALAVMEQRGAFLISSADI